MTVILVFVACLGLIAAVGLVRVLQLEAPPAEIESAAEPVRTLTLEPTPYRRSENFFGLIAARARVDLAFQITGRLIQLGQPNERLEEGDRVEAGQVLAVLDRSRYEAALQSAQADLASTQANIAGAQAARRQAAIRRDDAQVELARLRQLREQGAATARELEQAQVAVDLADAAVDAAEAQLASAEAAYQIAQAQAQVARVHLADAQLVAPFDGTVAAVPAEPGQTMQPGQAVLTLVDTQTVKVNLGVVERKLPVLDVGQDVNVLVEALQAPGSAAARRQGRVAVIPPAADPQTGLFNVEIELPNPDGALRPGMIAQAQVQLEPVEVFLVPAEAVLASGDRLWAFFVAPPTDAAPTPTAERVQLISAGFDDGQYLVRELPTPLRELVVRGHSRLTDGQPVRTVDAPPADAPGAG